MKPSILIVEDVKKIRDDLRSVLEGEFTVVAEAADGVAAVEAYKRFRPKLVVMDVVMPKMSGIEATTLILQEPNPPLVVMLSGLKDESIVMQALQAGAVDYLFKPIDADRLREILRGFLEKAA